MRTGFKKDRVCHTGALFQKKFAGKSAGICKGWFLHSHQSSIHNDITFGNSPYPSFLYCIFMSLFFKWGSSQDKMHGAAKSSIEGTGEFR